MEKNKYLLLGGALSIMVLTLILKKKARSQGNIIKKRHWQRKWIGRRAEGKGILTMLNEELLHEDPSSFKNFLRMDTESFQKLFTLVEPHIKKQDTLMRDCLPAKSKLEITLRFLASGETYRSLMYSTRIHESTMSRFIPEVCHVIYNVLKTENLSTPTNQQDWQLIAEEFEALWQFPNCIGALDGRHIKFRAPISSGSYYYNYKGDHSIVLLAMADAKYKITYCNVGVNGRISDGGVFRESGLFKAISSGRLPFPHNRPLPGRILETPYVIVADDAFPLSSRLMKPFPCRGLTYEQKIFNFRLSRARRIIESTFGILANRFRILLIPINLSPEKVEIITLACVTLHNYLATQNWKQYTEISQDETVANSLERIKQLGSNHSVVAAQLVREEFKHYFNSSGKVEWQNDMVRKHNM